MDDLNNLRRYFSNNNADVNFTRLIFDNMDGIESLTSFFSKNKILLILVGLFLLNNGFLFQILNLFNGYGRRNRFRGFDLDPTLLRNLLSLFLNGGFNKSNKVSDLAGLLNL